MGKQKSMMELLSNSNVWKVLNSANIFNEEFLINMADNSKDKSVFEIYSFSIEEDRKNYLARIIRKKDNFGINNWYIEFNNDFK